MRREKNDAGADQADERTGDVPAVGPCALDGPQPDEGRSDVDTAVRGVGAARRIRLDEGEQPGEQAERDQARRQPPGRGAEPQPRPEGEAAGDLEERRRSVGDDRLQNASAGSAIRVEAPALI